MGTIFKNVLLEDDTGGGCAAVTDTTLDRLQLVAQQVAGTHGPYRVDIDLLFR